MAGGRSGWPAILSNLKSVLETGKPMAIQMAPPEGFMEAVKRAVAGEALETMKSWNRIPA